MYSKHNMAFFYSNLKLVLIVSIITVIVKANGQIFRKNGQVAPVMKFAHLGKDWQRLSTTAAKNSIYSNKGDDLFVTCEASYPIQWRITGLVSPVEIVKILPPRRDIFENVFKIQVNIFFLDAGEFSGLAASTLVACEHIEDNALRDEIAVFVKGNRINPLIESTTGNTVADSKLIPCATTDPTTSTLLFKKNIDESETMIQDITYNPIEGFRSNNAFEGTYVCRKETYALSISIPKTGLNGHQYSPAVSQVRRFLDETIEFKCSSKTMPVEFAFFNKNETTTILTKNLESEKEAQLSIASNVLVMDTTIITGKVACLSVNSNGDRELIHEWNFELIKNPELYIDNIEGEADCLSGLSPKIVQSVRCKNSMDCNFMSQCLHDPMFCNYKKQKQFYAQTDTFCWVDEQNKGHDCVSVPFSHLNGIVQCSVRGLTRKWEFFISLDYLRYTNWKDAPERELVRIEEVGTQEKSRKTKLLCSASAFLFADSLIFQLEYTNGTQQLIKGQDVRKFEGSPLPSSIHRKIYELNIKSILDMELPLEVSSVNCIAPFWNSTEYLTARKSIKNTGLGRPEFLQLSQKEMKQTFHIGATDKNLTCISEEPNKTWLYGRLINQNVIYTNATEIFPMLNQTEEDGHLILFFPLIEKRHAGIYDCVFYDEQKHTVVKYNVKVIGEPISTSTATYVGLIILLLVIASLVGAAVVMFVRKRKEEGL